MLLLLVARWRLARIVQLFAARVLETCQCVRQKASTPNLLAGACSPIVVAPRHHRIPSHLPRMHPATTRPCWRKTYRKTYRKTNHNMYE